MSNGQKTAIAVAILGLALTSAKVDEAKKAIATDIQKGYNFDEKESPKYWTWETDLAAIVKALDVKYASDEHQKAAEKYFRACMVGMIRNSKKTWESVKADDATVSLVLWTAIFAFQLTAPKAAPTA